ncbi:hypothetical protein BH20ACI4_BH20ACI4_06980 [soil metagenome]
MDLTQALKDTENSLRDFIANILRIKFGESWIEKCGVSEDRVERWKERKSVEEKRQETGVVEERLLYYADFYDLKNILKKHWNEFTVALGDWKTLEVWLSELEKLRDPDAHRRELLPHQKHLALGISGEIRTRLVKFRSKQETSEDYFPRIDSARDNLGNIYTYGNNSLISTGMTLRVGDTVDFIITASDPLGENLQYRISKDYGDWSAWQDNNTFSATFTEANIGKIVVIRLCIQSHRNYHASVIGDDEVSFVYTVLPSK